jgi:hypothetical protein
MVTDGPSRADRRRGGIAFAVASSGVPSDCTGSASAQAWSSAERLYALDDHEQCDPKRVTAGLLGTT